MKILVLTDSQEDGFRQIEDIPASHLHAGDIVDMHIVPLDIVLTYEYIEPSEPKVSQSH